MKSYRVQIQTFGPLAVVTPAGHAEDVTAEEGRRLLARELEALPGGVEYLLLDIGLVRAEDMVVQVRRWALDRSVRLATADGVHARRSPSAPLPFPPELDREAALPVAEDFRRALADRTVLQRAAGARRPRGDGTPAA
ncbi:hypothetical protein [Streptomyces globisporus]|uniref:hypothetical protein n=1 Tax=Streptomyces globisporus TaxID=1908 RepID=UPI0004CAE70E|nr:hypothetical protein [Streptomyces globisporus]